MPRPSTGQAGIRAAAMAAFAAVVAVAVGPAPAIAADWRAFANPRFGYSVDVPAAYRAGPQPTNGDGRRFTSPDGAVTVRAYGAFLSDPGAFEADAKDTLASEQQDGLAVTYRAIAGDRYTISGLKGDRVVYLRAVPTCGRDAVATLRVDYPASAKASLDPLVAHMAASLRGSGRC